MTTPSDLPRDNADLVRYLMKRRQAILMELGEVEGVLIDRGVLRERSRPPRREDAEKEKRK